jgi:hypothetical protein
MGLKVTTLMSNEEFMQTYQKTHQHFKVRVDNPLRPGVWGNALAELCTQRLGRTGVHEYLVNRKWFTDADGVWIRKDCLDHEFVTWLALKSQ